MTDLHDAAVRAGLWSVIEARAKELKDAARAELLALETGDTVAGRIDGAVLAKATKTVGRTKLVISDVDGFTRWVADRWPTEVVVTHTINAAFVDVLRKRAIDVGAVIDTDGEVCPYAHVETGEPYVTIRKDKNAERVVADLFTSGRITLDGVKEIESL